MGDSEFKEEVTEVNDTDTSINEAENTAEEKDSSKKAQKTGKKKNRLEGFKKEFKKIVWPDKDTVIKESSEVIVVSILLSLIIAGLDLVIKLGLDRIL